MEWVETSDTRNETGHGYCISYQKKYFGEQIFLNLFIIIIIFFFFWGGGGRCVACHIALLILCSRMGFGNSVSVVVHWLYFHF